MARILVAASALSLAVTGCMHAGHAAGAAQPATAAPAPAGMGGMMGERCPMNVPGTQVSAADVATGEALTFTTTPDAAASLREKVHAMADMHNRHHAEGEHGPGGMQHGGMGGMGGMDSTAHVGDTEAMPHGGMGGMQMPPPSRATVEDLPNGARLVVTPNDPADLERLQATIRAHALQMQQHGCEGMGPRG
jgi:TusA-related sulfurtransferase